MTIRSYFFSRAMRSFSWVVCVCCVCRALQSEWEKRCGAPGRLIESRAAYLGSLLAIHGPGLYELDELFPVFRLRDIQWRLPFRVLDCLVGPVPDEGTRTVAV
jgi:hypothetical protein